MFCKHCGFEVPEGTKFCARCGRPMATSRYEEPNVSYEPEPSVGYDSSQPLQAVAMPVQDNASQADAAFDYQAHARQAFSDAVANGVRTVLEEREFEDYKLSVLEEYLSARKKLIVTAVIGVVVGILYDAMMLRFGWSAVDLAQPASIVAVLLIMVMGLILGFFGAFGISSMLKFMDEHGFVMWLSWVGILIFSFILIYVGAMIGPFSFAKQIRRYLAARDEAQKLGVA